jgi:hypothetical protein
MFPGWGKIMGPKTVVEDDCQVRSGQVNPGEMFEKGSSEIVWTWGFLVF